MSNLAKRLARLETEAGEDVVMLLCIATEDEGFLSGSLMTPGERIDLQFLDNESAESFRARILKKIDGLPSRYSQYARRTFLGALDRDQAESNDVLTVTIP